MVARIYLAVTSLVRPAEPLRSGRVWGSTSTTSGFTQSRSCVWIEPTGGQLHTSTLCCFGRLHERDPVYREWRSVRVVRDASRAVTHYVIVASEVGAQRPSIDSTNPNLRG